MLYAASAIALERAPSATEWSTWNVARRWRRAWIKTIVVVKLDPAELHEHLLHISLTISGAVDPTYGYTYNAPAGLLDDLMASGLEVKQNLRELFKDVERQVQVRELSATVAEGQAHGTAVRAHGRGHGLGGPHIKGKAAEDQLARELRLKWKSYLKKIVVVKSDPAELHEHLLHFSLKNAKQNIRELFKDFEVERQVLLDRRQQ